MQLEEFQKILNDIQSSTFQNKILTLLLNMFNEQDNIKRVLAEHQDKINSMITEINAFLEEEKEKKEKKDEL